MDFVLGVRPTVIVMIGVAVCILLFEKKRARRIERDLRSMGDRDDRNEER